MIADLHNKLRTLRLERRITQTEVSKRVGVSKAMISSYESGNRSPSYDVLVKLALFYNVSADFLLGIKKPTVDHSGLSGKELRAVLGIIEVLREKGECSEEFAFLP